MLPITDIPNPAYRKKKGIKSSWERRSEQYFADLTDDKELYYYELTSTGYDHGRVIDLKVLTYFCEIEGLLIQDRENRKNGILSDESYSVDNEDENLLKRTFPWGLAQTYYFSEIMKTNRPRFIDPKAGVNAVGYFYGKI